MLHLASSSLRIGLRGAASSACRRPRTSAASRALPRFKSTLTVVPASSSAPREVPIPLLFLTASKWTASPPAPEAFAKWIEHFSAQGYESLLLDLDPDQAVAAIDDSAKLMDIFEKEAIETLRQSRQASPFPPIMISRGPASLIAQTYVSSRPLTALQLVDPPISNTYLRKERPELLPTELEEFNFEARFPVRVVWSQAELQRQQELGVPWYDVHRIEYDREEDADESLDRYTFVDDKQGAEGTQEWLESDVDSLDGGVPSTSHDAVELCEDIDDVEDCLPEEDPSQDDQTPMAPGLADSGGEMPEWFTTGEYTLQPGSRKYPLTLDERHLSEKFIRGSGPGGQAINKLSTNVQLTHVPTGTKVTCQETRSRDRNRELARRRMSLVLEKLVRGEQGGSRIDRQIEKERRKKSNKKKKQKRRLKEKEQNTPSPATTTE